MTEAILVAVITGAMSLMGVVVTCLGTARKSEKKQEIAMAVMQTELAELTREVRTHNNFAQRMPIVEHEIKLLNGQIKELKAYHSPSGLC